MTPFPNISHIWPLYLIASGVSFALALSEVIVTFEREPLRALRTGGALLLGLINAALAALCLAGLRSLIPGLDSPWVALAVGLGLPGLARTRFTLFKPLPGAPESLDVEIGLAQLYERLQRFARRRIDLTLTREVASLLDAAVRQLPLDDLARRARILMQTQVTAPPEQREGYVERILTAEGYDETRRKTMLAVIVLDAGGRRMLEEMLRARRRT